MAHAERLFALAERLQARAQPQRPPTLEPFVVAGHAVGWVTSAVADVLTRDAGFDRRDGLLRLRDEGLDVAGRSRLLA